MYEARYWGIVSAYTIQQICCSTQTEQYSPLQGSCCPVWALQLLIYNNATYTYMYVNAWCFWVIIFNMLYTEVTYMYDNSTRIRRSCVHIISLYNYIHYIHFFNCDIIDQEMVRSVHKCSFGSFWMYRPNLNYTPPPLNASTRAVICLGSPAIQIVPTQTITEIVHTHLYQTFDSTTQYLRTLYSYFLT